MKNPLPRAPNPLSPRQTRIWHVALVVSSVGTYYMLREMGVDLKEPFVMVVYVACISAGAWLLRKYILSEIKDRS